MTPARAIPGRLGAADMQEVFVAPRPLDRLADVLPPERAARLAGCAARARSGLGDRVVWHVSSTASGGGVAEMLQTLLAYARGVGIDTRWLVLDADPDFFAITKRVHNMLHGDPGDGGSLAGPAQAHYGSVLARNLAFLLSCVSSRDIVVLHDPQTAGLVAGLRQIGARVVWRCHVGRDQPNELTDEAWAFLRPNVDAADAFVFSRRVYAPPWAVGPRLEVIPPSIDPYSSKNVALDPDIVDAVLARVGLLDGAAPGGSVRFDRRDGTVGSVRPHAAAGGLILDAPPPPRNAPLVVQVSRWDRLKDMAGVMSGFERMVQEDPEGDSHLMLVGPDTEGVSDDPEGSEILAGCRAQRHLLPDAVRSRVHLAAIPMDDLDENAVIVNAIQRRARVVVQKSLVEGFGLTVTEAMWKGRPVVASRVGGIQDQITHGRDGLLLDDPHDLNAFAGNLRLLLADSQLADRLGQAAHARVLSEYVGDIHLEHYVDLFERLLAGSLDGANQRG